MSTALHELFTGVLDYAGLFPPAKLPLPAACANFLAYRNEPESWMLGRFICPAQKLLDLEPLLAATPDSCFAVSALGSGGKTLKESLEGMMSDFNAILGFRATHKRRVVVDAYEVKLHPELLRSGKGRDLSAVVHGPETILARDDPRFAWYFELEPGPDWPQQADRLGAVLVEDRQRRKGLKLRTGGLDAAAFPSPEVVATAIDIARRHEVPLKFTAGLHHPFRHFDATVQSEAHGFLNVFTAGVLAHGRRLDVATLTTLLTDTDPSNFHFDDTGLRWRDHDASVTEIREARKGLVHGFGSCSFDEPRDDLRKLGLLPARES
jgi:hypothetical protein